jgi:hypothetical protein
MRPASGRVALFHQCADSSREYKACCRFIAEKDYEIYDPNLFYTAALLSLVACVNLKETHLRHNDFYVCDEENILLLKSIIHISSSSK